MHPPLLTNEGGFTYVLFVYTQLRSLSISTHCDLIDKQNEATTETWHNEVHVCMWRLIVVGTH